MSAGLSCRFFFRTWRTPSSSLTTLRPLASSFSASSSTNNTDWIPPVRPQLSDGIDDPKELEGGELHPGKSRETIKPPAATSSSSPDWLQTRRSLMASQSSASVPSLQPQLQGAKLDIKMHTLLARTEIVQLLKAMGGSNVSVVLDDPQKRRMGGATGMIVATVAQRQVRVVADRIVQSMRERQLQQCGVLGAIEGYEGADDPNETWIVVDCGNYIVHVQDETIRTALRLEDIWTGKDGLHKVDLSNDEAIEDYVEANPVPDDYNPMMVDVEDTLKQIQKTRWTVPHRPVLPPKKTKKVRRRR